MKCLMCSNIIVPTCKMLKKYSANFTKYPHIFFHFANLQLEHLNTIGHSLCVQIFLINTAKAPTCVFSNFRQDQRISLNTNIWVLSAIRTCVCVWLLTFAVLNHNMCKHYEFRMFLFNILLFKLAFSKCVCFSFFKIIKFQNFFFQKWITQYMLFV